MEFIYAGPQAFDTPKAFRPSTDFRALADKGCIVVRSDGMGTNWPSKTALLPAAKTPPRPCSNHADFYKAAVAGRRVSHDNRLGIPCCGSEMFMGYPVDESYDRCSNVTHARTSLAAR
ncbi:hypothetical protein MY11210_000129 [Beauveria gryllotalpidicola]